MLLHTCRSSRLILAILVLFTINVSIRAQASISTEQLTTIIGQWEGTLTYVDYTSGEPFTMPANLNVEASGNDYELKMNHIYPNEPQANNTSKLKISKDGSKINSKALISNQSLDTGEQEYIVEYKGKDGNDNKKALIHEVYLIGANTFSIEKRVQFEGTTEWITRNTFKYRRK